MNHNYVFSNINDALPALMRDLLAKGEKFGSRAGETLELTHVGITLRSPQKREIVIPERKANLAAQIVETMWVLSGRNDVAGLIHYLPRAADFSDNGLDWRAGYGPRLRNYHGVDQLAYIVDTLAGNPSSRQAVATIWDPTVDTNPGKDIACNNWLSFSSRNGLLDLQVGIRSNDAMWGWSGINAFEWSVLLELVAVLTNLEIGSLHFATTSFHLYEQHWDKANKIAKVEGNFMYTTSPGMECPSLQQFDDNASNWFALEESIRFGKDVRDLVDSFPDPMLQSWLRVLQWYWSGNMDFLDPLRRTRLYMACVVGMKPAGQPQPESDSFLDFVNKLHAQKHAAYGDSWKRRGEYMILANIARKVDRLESGKDTPDETQADTAIDLMVYLAKYRSWLSGGQGDPDEVEAILQSLVGRGVDPPNDIVACFNRLELRVNSAGTDWVMDAVDDLLVQAYTLARSLWQ